MPNVRKLNADDLTSLFATKLTIDDVPSLFLFFDKDHQSTNLPLPRKGRKHLTSNPGQIRFLLGDDCDIACIGAGSYNKHIHASVGQYFLNLGGKVYDTLVQNDIMEVNLLNALSPGQESMFIYGMYLRAFNNGASKQEVKIGNLQTSQSYNARAAALSTNLTRRLINIPYGIHVKGEQKGLVVQRFVDFLNHNFKDENFHTLQYRTISDLVKINAGGILSVGRASTQSPALVEITYCPKGCENQPPSIFVAKGIMYDSGGAALKTPQGMKNMKYDMSAAAVGAGVLERLKRTNAKAHVKVVFCLAENAIGPEATYNGDHVHMMDGKVVENTNTDAEGRMVLYDGLVYAQQNYPQAQSITSMGTLTGIGKTIFGGRCGLAYAPSEQTSTGLLSHNQNTHKINDIYVMPDDPRTDQCVYSGEPGVDLVNSQQTMANGGEYCYKFLKASIREENLGKYAHIDIGGGIVFGNKDITDEPLNYATGTGWGVDLMYSILTQSTGA